MKKRFKGEVSYIIFTPIMRLIFTLWYHPQIINKQNIPKKGPIIITSNHKHVYDQCHTIIATKRPIHYMAKKEYFDGKFAWFFKMFGCISVNRKIKDYVATNTAIEILKNNGAIGLFPEGTRNKTYDTLLLPFKFGAVSMAQKTGALIIPSCITGDYKFHSKNLMIRYGTPFKVPSDMDLTKANDKLRKEIEALINQNLKDSNRTKEEELKSRNQDQKNKV